MKLRIKVILIFLALLFFTSGCRVLNLQKTSFVKPGLFEGKIAFVSDREVDTRNIYTVNADGTNFKLIPTNTYMNNAPSYSPDGKKLHLKVGQVKKI